MRCLLLALLLLLTDLARPAFEPSTVDFGKPWSYVKADHDETQFLSLTGFIRRDANLRGEAFWADWAPGSSCISSEILGLPFASPWALCVRSGIDHPAGTGMVDGAWNFGTPAFQSPPNVFKSDPPNALYYQSTPIPGRGEVHAVVIVGGVKTVSPPLWYENEFQTQDWAIAFDGGVATFWWLDPVLGWQSWSFLAALTSPLRPGCGSLRVGSSVGGYYVWSHQVLG